MNMGKGKSPIEIYLMLFTRMKPSDIIKLGYSRFTVYSYSRRFPEILERYNNKIKGN